MSVLNKPYELSVWTDEWDDTQDKFVEQRLCVIGSNAMVSQSRALNPKLVTNVNGTNTFSFMIYYRYKDTITGEEVENPFAQYLTNERKLKLYYDDKWYDLLIKNVKVDSTKYSYDITATDQYINELSKNGFNITFDAEMRNNVGTVQTLASRTLADTDWEVIDRTESAGVETESEFIADRAKETLVTLLVGSDDITAVQLVETSGKEPQQQVNQTIPSGSTIYGFYPCCKEKSSRFQFIYIPDETEIEIDDERVIQNKDCQYFIDDVQYSTTQSFGVYAPTFSSVTGISSQYRGARYVFSPDMEYNPVIKQYVTKYAKGSPATYYWGYTTTEYKAPNLIANLVTNPNAFKNTAGWRPVYIGDSGRKGTLENFAYRRSGSTDIRLMDDLKNGDFDPSNPAQYVSKLEYDYTDASNHALINTGFYDNRKLIKNLIPGKQYVIQFRASHSNFTITCGKYRQTNAADIDQWSLIETYWSANQFTTGWDAEGTRVRYAIVTVNDNARFSPKQYQTGQSAAEGKVLIAITPTSNVKLQITDFQIFEYLPCIRPDTTDIRPYVAPEDQLPQAKTITTYHLYPEAVGQDSTKTLDDYSVVYEGTQPFEDLGYTTTLTCEKRRAITIKESNYFNIIQTLCETFECWAHFKINHDTEGNITSKQLIFKNQAGVENFAGFRYGVNLKSITRTDDSKSIVTKLIVRQNSNEFGKNGFCTIARAPSNPSGETCLYNFDYYIQQGLLRAEDWINAWYNTADGQGFESRFNAINATLQNIADGLANQAATRAQAQKDLTLCLNGYNSAIENLEAAADSFAKMFYGAEWNHFTTQESSEGDNPPTYINPDFLEKNIKYLTACCEYYQASVDYQAKLATAQSYYNQLNLAYTALNMAQTTQLASKSALLKEFYSKFFRYIQEGTWNSEEYYDDEQYYLDAQSTLYNSSMPKVSYTMSVLELSQLIGYTDFTFKLGDRTFVEDPEFFGYDDNGAPVREQVVLTEITYNLDQPEKNSIKIQTYKTQFQDLFKKITATVQSVQYSTGAYDKAAQLADADNAQKSQYLQGALTAAGTILTNLAEQTVRLDSEGLTIVDGFETNKALRAVSGGILLTEDGGNTWKTGITANGVSAEVLTSGILNTSEVNIMYGSEPTFRWDSLGLTAYSYDLDSSQHATYIDPHSGVRFDRLGLYGFSGVDGDWHPTDIVDWEISNNQYIQKQDGNGHFYLRNHSMFELTKEGLHLSLGDVEQKHYLLAMGTSLIYSTLSTPVTHTSAISIGRVNDLIFNTWNQDNIPYYNTTTTTNPTFIQVITAGVGTNPIDAPFQVYDDGTLIANKAYIRGNIAATSGSIAGWEISANALYKSYTDSLGTTKYIGWKTPSLYTDLVLYAGASDVNGTDAVFSVNAAGSLRASIGVIGGWYIASDYLYKSPTYLYTKDQSTASVVGGASRTDWRIKSSNNFGVTKEGILYASNAVIEGNVTATEFILVNKNEARITTEDVRFPGAQALFNTLECTKEVRCQTLRASNSIYTNYLMGITASGNTQTANLYLTITVGEPFIGVPPYVPLTITLKTNNTHWESRIGNYTLSVETWARVNGVDYTDVVHVPLNTLSSANPTITTQIPYGFSGAGVLQGISVDYGNTYHLAETFDYSGKTYSYGSVNSKVQCSSDLVPTITGQYNLGTSGFKWDNLYVGTIHSTSPSYNNSARSLKDQIECFASTDSIFFDSLQPRKYLLNNIAHKGFIIDEVCAAATFAGLNPEQCGVSFSNKDQNPFDPEASLCYNDFIALNTWQIQLLKSRVATLEQKCLDLENRLNNLDKT